VSTQSSRVFGAVALVAAFLGMSSPAASQTIRPLLAEHTSRAKGRVELHNDAAWPLDVVIEARGFAVNEAGELVDLPMSQVIRLKLSAMSLRIPPKQTRYVFYDASAEVLPAWFVLYANFRGYPARDFKGTNVQLELPHVVYILPKQQLQESDIGVRLVDFAPDRRLVIVDVWNTGQEFGRVIASEIRGAGHKKTGESFPLLPGGRRRLEMEWDGSEPPDAIVLKTRSYVVQRALLLTPSQ
jgi:hypothetical protein